MIVEINGYELETENIVKFYPCDILGNHQKQSNLTYIEFKDGFKGIYVCNATELLEKMQNCGADMRNPNCVTCDHFGDCDGCEKGETDNFSAILDMTDQQAADIIEDMYFNPQMVRSRHQGKTYMQACRMVAVLKAIHKLRGDTNCLR